MTLRTKLYYYIIIVMLICIVPFMSYGQGAILDTAFYDDLPSQSTYGDGAKSEAEALENIFKVDLKPYCPTIGYQGSYETCTGWSVGYAAQTIQYALMKNWEGEIKKITSHAFSIHFLYNQLKDKKIERCTIGTHIGKALEILKTKGNVLFRYFDHDNDCAKYPNEKDLDFAKNYRIKNYTTLFGSGAKPKLIKHKIKLSLAQKKPVIIGMPVTKKFTELRTAIWQPQAGDSPVGGHAMVIIGFDDSLEAFELMNSWGKNWGDGGFCWIKYDDLINTQDIEGYQMELYSSSTEIPEDNAIDTLPAQLTANFSFNTPVEYPDYIMFENIPLLYKEETGIYDIQQTLKLGDIAQFNLSGVSERTYVYMFSYNSNDVNVHWPRDEELDSKFDGLHESALITVPEVKLVLPTPNTALQFNMPGEEYLCFLFSKSPINDFNEKISLLAIENDLSFKENINEIFTKKDRDKGNTISRSGKVAELSASVNDQQVVPVIYKLQVEE